MKNFGGNFLFIKTIQSVGVIDWSFSEPIRIYTETASRYIYGLDVESNHEYGFELS